MDKGNLNIAVFVDLKKAFDTVDHTILLNKLQYYGFIGDELKWIQSYLSNGSQKCFINGVLSNTGIPAGKATSKRRRNDVETTSEHVVESTSKSG